MGSRRLYSQRGTIPGSAARRNRMLKTPIIHHKRFPSTMATQDNLVQELTLLEEEKQREILEAQKQFEETIGTIKAKYRKIFEMKRSVLKRQREELEEAEEDRPSGYSPCLTWMSRTGGEIWTPGVCKLIAFVMQISDFDADRCHCPWEPSNGFLTNLRGVFANYGNSITAKF
eukprot:maker-scaffold67_size430214-snap-gene-3.29 protein:Tk00787 transcript:maker-scaffold67_size430214-snap-gene-3.29-mRNA-1 annotation:"hypothetical protein"